MPLWLCVTGVTIAASTSSVRVSGSVVFDGDGLPISNAHVWIHEQSKNEMVSIPLDKTGRFDTELPSGYYDVFIGAPGFAPFCQKLWVRTGEPTSLKIRLSYDKKNAQMN